LRAAVPAIVGGLALAESAQGLLSRLCRQGLCLGRHRLLSWFAMVWTGLAPGPLARPMGLLALGPLYSERGVPTTPGVQVGTIPIQSGAWHRLNRVGVINRSARRALSSSSPRIAAPETDVADAQPPTSGGAATARATSLFPRSRLAQGSKLICQDVLICGGIGLPTSRAGKRRSQCLLEP